MAFVYVAAVFLVYKTAYTFAYENIALNRPTWQSRQYIPMNSLFNSSNAVDGQKTDLMIWSGQCAVSADRQSTATLWVNLTSIQSVHNIRIYYRTDNVAWDASNGYTARFLGFYVYVSNTTDRFDGHLCFHDTNYTRATIPSIANITCTVHGQYVIYYNERPQDAARATELSQYAFIELCEVEVYGCNETGVYGPDCSLPCPDTNCRYCHIETGACQGCKPGYQGHRCELPCGPQFYGELCFMACGNCSEGRTCHHVNGSCTNGCDVGVYGDKCKTPCPEGWHGQNCSQVCSNCDNCNRISGQCTSPCKPGWKGLFCKDACSAQFYGYSCSLKCGNCTNGVTCNHVNGSCTNGCDVGVYGDKCQTPCSNGWHGHNCSEKCSNCNECNKFSGQCTSPCKPGWKGPFCKEECDGGRYGQDCGQSCGTCLGYKQCHHINGTCLEGCHTGYEGNLCKTGCSSGKFGINCEQNCNENCSVPYQCNRATGECEGGCQPGWEGPRCDQVCKQNKYGENCFQTCGFCKDPKCHHINGSCPGKCLDGYQGTLCNKMCETGFYGENCKKECSLFCKSSRDCNHVTGYCNEGCIGGWQGAMCLQISEKTDVADRFYGVLAAICVCLTIIGILIAYICIYRWKMKGKLKKLLTYKEDKETKASAYNMDIVSSKIYEDDKNGYQELGELALPSDYDRI